MGGLSPWHWIVVIAAFALLFGAKRLPDAARSVGRSLRIFRAEMGTAGQSGGEAAAYDGSAGGGPTGQERPAPRVEAPRVEVPRPPAGGSTGR
ncbi:Sec-independent protein translocase subunit TatA [Streptoalloteichus hindustanus]|uniref:Sec-independent protein translocase protein TatA n=1 Tax=Streptoalloteichus hindustanus TaxID=2017 RepID=A0A1M5GZQ9_STRHI|nr:Sec-independent protein translocase subunit TatA [Streptoalloteichus hindustanus]SHG09135.1 sec-independent protein translocase protein TatA [Streptoalloteichus hindustanus]